jgi:large subunit ribosomal protein L25
VSDNIGLALTKRTATGKKVVNLRHSGQIPGVVYGHDFMATNVQAPEVKFSKVVAQAGKHHLVNLDIDGVKEMGLIKSIDVDPVKNTIRHVAFHIVKQDEAVETEVPIKLIGEGESEAERAGLVVLQSLETLKIRALPRDLPDSLDVSIIALAEPGQGVTIGDITIPKGVELAEENMEITVASVYEPSALAAANDAAGGSADEDTEVEAENGEDTLQDTQAEETKPGGKAQDEPKQSNVDANKK